MISKNTKNKSLLLSLFAFCLLQCTPSIEKIKKSELDTIYQNVMIGKREPGMRLGPCEPSIYINPTNTKHIVAGSVLNNFYHSHDSGITWESGILESSMGVFGDPVIYADQKGNFYYLHLSDPSGKGWADSTLLDRIVIQKSMDQGRTWNDGSGIGQNHPKDQDKEWICSDPENGNLYVTWTEFDKYGSKDTLDKSRILFSKSTNYGETWSDETPINQFDGDCIDDDMTTEGAVPAVGPDGQVYVAWSYDSKIYFDRSKDYGNTWLKNDIVAVEHGGGWAFDIPGIGRANGMPVTGVDLSNGSHNGRIYINYSDQINGVNDTDIWLIYSDDEGTTWSSPKRVNNDESGKHQFFNWMAIDQKTGYLYIVFYDRRNHEDTNTDVYIAWSEDGGENFINKKISITPFEPGSGIFFGDYNNISAHDGIIRPIWTRADGTDLSIWTAIINRK